MSTVRTVSQLVIRLAHARTAIRTSSSVSSRSIKTAVRTPHSFEPDPFAAVDRLNGRQPTRLPSTDKLITSRASTSIPLSVTTGSPGQSAAIESHPSTSIEDLHPLPPLNSQTTIDTHNESSPDSSISKTDDLSDGTVNWSRSFSGLSQKPFSREASDVLMAPIDPMDVEIKPDGVIYLPEIKYRRILNRAFGPGGWGLAPRGSSHITLKNVSREYGLVCLGRLVSLARGEQDYYNGADNIPTATEGCKSNALMRCCKDLGIASELWDPNYIHWWKNKFASVEWVSGTGLSSGKKKPVWKKQRPEDWTPNLP